jgi:hypothetical protein
MKTAMLMMITAGLLAVTPMSAPMTAQPSPDASVPAVYTKYGDVKWEKLIPELGAQSAEIAILHVDPKSGATQLMIRCPKNYHAVKHWHTANETHYCVYGHFVMLDQDGKAADLGPGSFNYMPSKMLHEGWSKADEGNLLFITVDGPWDIHFVDGPPTPQQVQDVSKRPELPTSTKPVETPSSKSK